jgi:MFS family permease
VTGVQTAITLYALVMAALMITGGKLGALLGRKRMFVVGAVIYACGSLTTALSPNLAVLIVGWSGLEGIGAALIMPAVVALVAANFPAERRTAAYGAVAAAGAVAVAAGPIIGGAVTTSFSWRWVFAGEVVVALAIALVARRLADAEPESRSRLDVVGVLLSILGLSAIVFGFLKAGSWGWVAAKPGAPSIGGLSPTLWLIVAGLVVLWLLMRWEHRVEARGREPLVYRSQLRNRRLTSALSLFGSQFFMQSGVFFTVPLFLSVILGLSAL